jgi:hypothetical protein
MYFDAGTDDSLGQCVDLRRQFLIGENLLWQSFSLLCALCGSAVNQ